MFGQSAFSCDAMREDLRRRRWMARERMPEELRGARLVLSEEPLQILAPIPLAGIPDQVYGTDDGYLVPVDTKTRRRPVIRRSDIAQLSVYGVLLTHSTDPRLTRYGEARHGYVRLELPDRVQYVKIPLAPEETVVKMWLNHWWFGSIGPRAGLVTD